MEQEIREAQQQIDQWQKDNEEQYYGLSREEVNDVLREFEDCLSQIAELRERNESLRTDLDRYKRCLEKYGEMIVIDSEDHPQDVGMLAREELGRRTR